MRSQKAVWERGAKETVMLASKSLGLFKKALKQMTQELVPNTWEAPVCCMAVTQPSLAESENNPGLPTVTEEKSLSRSHTSDSRVYPPKTIIGIRYKAIQPPSHLESAFSHVQQ